MLFKSKEEKKLEEIELSLIMNLQNNYKDNAQEELVKLEAEFEKVKLSGKLSEKKISKYESKLCSLRKELDGFSHKDQKPYWH